MWRTYCCLRSFFLIVDTCLSCEDIARQGCAMVPRWRFLATFLDPAFPASRVQHISDLHLKFALRPHHVWKTSNLRRLRLGRKKRKKKEETTGQKYNGLPYSTAAIINGKSGNACETSFASFLPALCVQINKSISTDDEDPGLHPPQHLFCFVFSPHDLYILLRQKTDRHPFHGLFSRTT